MAECPTVLVAVTDHAAERYRQRVRGTLDAKGEVVARVVEALRAGRFEEVDRHTIRVRDPRRRNLFYVCPPGAGELVVVTLWEEGDDAAVPRRFTDALRDGEPRRQRGGADV